MLRRGGNTMKLLPVEDEVRMADALRELLKQEGYAVAWVEDGGDGLNLLLESAYGCTILENEKHRSIALKKTAGTVFF